MQDELEVAQIDVADPWSKFSSGPATDQVSRCQPATTTNSSNDENRYEHAVDINDLSFSYPGVDGRPVPGARPIVQAMTAKLKPGSRCLLIGPNGAGKTTLLKTLGGKHMVPKSDLRILGEPPFHATHLTSSGSLSYIGGNWERDIAFAGYAVPLQGDIPAGQMLGGVPDVDPKRRQQLMEVLDINPGWRMHLVSDGQRRRVQLAMGLLKPFKVLLLDEITVDLDVLGRADLMQYLKEETQQRNATIIYATHIFDGLESWPTHIMYVSEGQLKLFEAVENIPELKEGRLLNLVERWLRDEKSNKDVNTAPNKVDNPTTEIPSWNNGWAAGRLASTIKHSANTVWRM